MCSSEGLIFAIALMSGYSVTTCAQGIYHERVLTSNTSRKLQPTGKPSYKKLYEEQLLVAEELRSILKKAQDLLGQAAPLNQPVSATCDEYNSGKGFAPGCIVVPRANLTGFGEDYCLNPYPMGSGFLGTLHCDENDGSCYYLPCCTSMGENPCVIPEDCTSSKSTIDPWWNIIFPDYAKSVKYESNTETCSSIPCLDTKGKFSFNSKEFTCKRVRKNVKKRCKKQELARYCPETCNLCNGD